MTVPAMATSVFSTHWKNAYVKVDGVDEDFKKNAGRASCYICHIKNHPDKKKVRNEYGEAINKYLKMKDFEKDWVKANPEEAKKYKDNATLLVHPKVLRTTLFDGIFFFVALPFFELIEDLQESGVIPVLFEIGRAHV